MHYVQFSTATFKIIIPVESVLAVRRAWIKLLLKTFGKICRHSHSLKVAQELKLAAVHYDRVSCLRYSNSKEVVYRRVQRDSGKKQRLPQ